MCTSSRISDFSQTGIIRNQVDYIILPDCLTGAVDAGIECQHIGTRLLQVRDSDSVGFGRDFSSKLAWLESHRITIDGTNKRRSVLKAEDLIVQTNSGA